MSPHIFFLFCFRLQRSIAHRSRNCHCHHHTQWPLGLWPRVRSHIHIRYSHLHWIQSEHTEKIKAMCCKAHPDSRAGGISLEWSRIVVAWRQQLASHMPCSPGWRGSRALSPFTYRCCQQPGGEGGWRDGDATCQTWNLLYLCAPERLSFMQNVVTKERSASHNFFFNALMTNKIEVKKNTSRSCFVFPFHHSNMVYMVMVVYGALSRCVFACMCERNFFILFSCGWMLWNVNFAAGQKWKWRILLAIPSSSTSCERERTTH